MCCSKQSAPAQSVNQTQTSQPWSGQVPYLTGGTANGQNVQGVFPLAYQAYAQNPSFNPYPGPWIASQAPETLAAQNLTTSRALSGSPVTSAAQGNLVNTINGNFADPALNPGWQTMVDRIKGQVAPGISSQFANSGNGGGLKQRALGLGLGDAIGSLAYQNYGAERDRAMSASLNAPQFAQADYNDISQLAGVGAAKEQREQNTIGANQQYYQGQQQAPWGPLGLYAGNVSGNYGGTTTSSGQTYQPINSTANTIGSIASLAGIAGLLFSDERLKKDKKRIGKTDSGVPIYSYKYKWGGPKMMGVMAQDLIAKQPGAVHNVGGLLAVDYGKVR